MVCIPGEDTLLVDGPPSSLCPIPRSRISDGGRDFEKTSLFGREDFLSVERFGVGVPADFLSRSEFSDSSDNGREGRSRSRIGGGGDMSGKDGEVGKDVNGDSDIVESGCEGRVLIGRTNATVTVTECGAG